MRNFIYGLILSAVGWASANADPLDDLLAEAEGFSGVVLIDEGSAVTDFRSRGFADDDAERPFSPDDVWRWASVTKQLIGVLVMQEVQAGRLSLDDTLAERLPEAKTRNAKTITVADLLRHTSGMRPPRSLPTEQLDPVEFCSTRPISKPGKRFVYNNCDTVLAAAIVEKTSGMPWPELLAKRIFEPAGMATATAKPFGEDLETVVGRLTAAETEPSVDVAFYGAAGSVVGQAGDLIAFNRALMDGDLLSAEARAELWTGVPQLGFVALGAWSFSAPLKGCEGTVKLVERRGDIQGVEVRNFIAPGLNKSVVVFVNRGDFTFGEVWRGEGFSYDLLSTALCGA